MSLSKYETETVIQFNDERDTANVYTCHKRIMTAIEKRGIQPECEYKNCGRVVAKSYEVPKNWIKINPPRRVSEEQRQKLSQRMKSRINSVAEKA